MQPDAFLEAFARTYRQPTEAENTVAGWTAYMAPRIRQALGAKFCCTTTVKREVSAQDTNSLHREHLFDFTFYCDGDFYRLPEVIVEHENHHGDECFMYDFWKLMLGYAPLRVMFGYAKDDQGVGDRVGAIKLTARKAAWRYPPDVHDLVLLRSPKLPLMEWRTVTRFANTREWVPGTWNELHVRRCER